MTTRLQGPLKREIQVGEDAYTLTISPEGLLLARKGHRKGTQLRWTELVSGEAALGGAQEDGGGQGMEGGGQPGH